EAQLRTTSVYLPDRVCPMLPEKLSNLVCSLRPDEDKCAFSVLFDFDQKMEIRNYTFAKTVIRSNKRFTYEQAQEVLEGEESPYSKEVLYMNKLAYHLREQRFKNGSINFETEEVRFRFDENNHPIDVYVKERKDAHMLVEDFMLLANTTVSKYLSIPPKDDKIKRSSVYRVHDKPSQEKLGQLSAIARRFGHTFNFKDESKIQDTLTNMMEIIKDKPEKALLSKMAVRTMSKAEYTTTNIGHYGLAFENYTHFTSPIRRYPDVLIHRLLHERLLHEKPQYTSEELQNLCAKSSDMERRAQGAEREAIKYKQAEYLHDRMGEEFTGIISGVISRGFFVELDANKCEGFVSVQDFDEDFTHDEDNLSLTGLRSKNRFAIGDPITVIVAGVNVPEKRI
ncbi:MAG: ribonuclease R family protein, partial [Chitinophagales bacterium]